MTVFGSSFDASNSDALSTIYAVLIEGVAADLFVVVGLAGQKVAMMQTIEKEAEEELGSNSPFIAPTHGYRDSIVTFKAEVKPSVLSNWKWLLGLVIYIMGQILEVVALGFGSETQVVAMSNLTLPWNALISVFMFKEEFNVYPKYKGYKMLLRWDLFSISILIIGSFCTVLFSPPPPDDTNVTADDLLKQWTAPPFCYFGIILLITLFFSSSFLWKNWGHEAETGNLNAFLITSICSMLAAFTMTMSKVTTSLLKKSFDGDNQYNNPAAVFMTIIWFSSLLISLYLLNVGLARYEQGLIVPLYEVLSTGFCIVAGILYYNTYKLFSTLDWVGFFIGLLLMIWGVWLTAQREHHSQAELQANLHQRLNSVDKLLHHLGRSASFSGNTDGSLDDMLQSSHFIRSQSDYPYQLASRRNSLSEQLLADGEAGAEANGSDSITNYQGMEFLSDAESNDEADESQLRF